MSPTLFTAEFLLKFCSKSEHRPNMTKPFKFQGKTYATNGHIAVEIDHEVDGAAEQDTTFHPNVAKVIHDYQTTYVDGQKAIDLSNVEPSVACEMCNGSGFMHKCQACDGQGEFDHFNHSYTCKTCEGDGYAPPGHHCAGEKSPCWHCGGTKLQFGKRHKVAPWIGFDVVYLNLVKELPEPVFVASPDRHKYGVGLFTFQGGRGVLMELKG